MKKLAILLTVIALAAPSSWAVDLINKDDKSYDVKIKDGPSTTNTSIAGSTHRPSVCSSCTIEVVGVGEVEASGDEKVVIKGGKISKE